MQLTLNSSFSPWIQLRASSHDARAIFVEKAPPARRSLRLMENREGERAWRTRRSWPFFQGGRRRGLNGDTVLNEGRVHVGVGQGQALVSLPDVVGDLGQAALEGGDAPPRGLLGEVLVRVGAQGPLGENQVRGQGDVQGSMENNEGPHLPTNTVKIASQVMNQVQLL